MEEFGDGLCRAIVIQTYKGIQITRQRACLHSSWTSKPAMSCKHKKTNATGHDVSIIIRDAKELILTSRHGEAFKLASNGARAGGAGERKRGYKLVELFFFFLKSLLACRNKGYGESGVRRRAGVE